MMVAKVAKIRDMAFRVRVRAAQNRAVRLPRGVPD